MHSLLSKSNLLTAITLTLLLINDVHSYPTPGKTIAIPINHAAADSWNPSKIEREPVPKGPDYDIHTNFGFDGIPIKLFNDTSGHTFRDHKFANATESPLAETASLQDDMDYAFNDKTFIAVKLEPDIISISKSTILNLFNGNLDITATKGTLPNGNIDITAIKSILPSGNLDAATTKATLPDKTITIGILDTTIPTATPTKGTIPNKTLPCNTLTNGIAGTIHTTTGTFLNDSLANGILVTTRNTPKSSHTVKLAISVAAAFAFVFTAAGLISFITYWSRSRVFKQYRTAVADPRVRNDPKYAHLLAPPIRRRMDIDPSTFSAAPRSRIPAHVRLKHYPHKQGSSRPSAARRALMEDSSTEGSVGSDGLQSPHGAGL